MGGEGWVSEGDFERGVVRGGGGRGYRGRSRCGGGA